MELGQIGETVARWIHNRKKVPEVPKTNDEAKARAAFELLNTVGAQGQNTKVSYERGSTVSLHALTPGTIIREQINRVSPDGTSNKINNYAWWYIGEPDPTTHAVNLWSPAVKEGHSGIFEEVFRYEGTLVVLKKQIPLDNANKAQFEIIKRPIYVDPDVDVDFSTLPLSTIQSLINGDSTLSANNQNTSKIDVIIGGSIEKAQVKKPVAVENAGEKTIGSPIPPRLPTPAT